MNYPVVTLVACMMMIAASGDAEARRNCEPRDVQACKDDAARLCRNLPRQKVAKCLDDLTEDCATPSVLCEPPKFGLQRVGPKPPPLIRQDPMDIAPKDR